MNLFYCDGGRKLYENTKYINIFICEDINLYIDYDDFYRDLYYSLKYKIITNIYISIKFFDFLDAHKIKIWGDKHNMDLLLTIFNPLSIFIGHIKNNLIATNTIEIFDIFNIYPYCYYEKTTGRQEFFHNNLLAWGKYNKYLSDFIMYFELFFNENNSVLPLNSKQYFFSCSEISGFVPPSKYDPVIFSSLLEDKASLSLLVDVCRFYRMFYNKELLDILNLDEKLEEKIGQHINFLEKDNRDYNTTRTWYKGENLHVFGVDLGECLEYHIMNFIVKDI